MAKIARLAVLSFFCLCLTQSNAREITHEDIKDAMLSLVHMMRENTEKLERHEARERQLGEQMKKAIALLSKRLNVLDNMQKQLTKLDDRVGGLEQIISQRDERERIQMQKTADSLEDLQSRLEGWLTDIESKIAAVNSNRPDTTIPALSSSMNVITKLNDTMSPLAEQISRLESSLKTLQITIPDDVVSQFRETHKMYKEVEDIRRKIDMIGSSLNEMQEHAEMAKKKPEENQLNIVSRLEEQRWALAKTQELLETTADRIKELPRMNEVQTLHNETRTTIQEARHAVEDTMSRGINDIGSKLSENKEEAKDSVNALRMDLANNAERMNQELNDLEKGQSVMVSMADHVLDTKKRVEYGVHQILLEVGDLVKAQGVNINNTLNQRFDGISNDIMDNQNGALANLTTKMEFEMNQVWRQINVMYQQMMESAKALEKLHKQNEAYVNGTTSTMGGMESKVIEITKRMAEVDENLNYLLGRLSLVTHEFNQIKTGLGNALDNIKASFKEVQEKANDLNRPGPHPVPENYKEIDDGSDIKKPDVVTVK